MAISVDRGLGIVGMDERRRKVPRPLCEDMPYVRPAIPIPHVVQAIKEQTEKVLFLFKSGLFRSSRPSGGKAWHP
jgi:hypothetical protein